MLHNEYYLLGDIYASKVKFTKNKWFLRQSPIVRNKGYMRINMPVLLLKILGCSTQPVFPVFENMEQLKKAVISRQMLFTTAISMPVKRIQKKPYKATGLAYIRFAKEERNYSACCLCGTERRRYFKQPQMTIWITF